LRLNGIIKPALHDHGKATPMLRLHIRFASVAAATLLLLVVGDGSAHAYIDPGTGSYVLQAVAAGVLAAIFVAKNTWQSIVKAVCRIFSRGSDGR